MMETGNVIKNFKDLVVYKSLYSTMLVCLKEIVPNLPKEEKFDLTDQIRRCCKAGPALIAEGFAKRYQKLYWRKYIDDTIGECNEMIHHLTICVDVYGSYVDSKKCLELIGQYDVICRQLTKLKQVWTNYHDLRS